MNVGALILSCEHGGNQVPAAYRKVFQSTDARAALESHRGQDIGALSIAKSLSKSLHTGLEAATVTRLLVDLNRSMHHRGLFSDFSAQLDATTKTELIEKYYLPYRQRVIDRILQHPGKRVCHIGVHSFTPNYKHEERQADIGLLYDPQRAHEAALCTLWLGIFKRIAPTLRIRRNYPYRGKADGLTTALRQRFSEHRYLGIELEVNQASLTGPKRIKDHTTAAIVASALELFGSR